MNAVYVVVENGEPYKVAYASFDSAAAVKEKHREELEAQLLEAGGQKVSFHRFSAGLGGTLYF